MFENMSYIVPPWVIRITITTTDTNTRIKAYSTIPCPSWKRARPFAGFDACVDVGAVVMPMRTIQRVKSLS